MATLDWRTPPRRSRAAETAVSGVPAVDQDALRALGARDRRHTGHSSSVAQRRTGRRGPCHRAWKTVAVGFGCLIVASAVGGCNFGDPDVDDRPERPGELGNGTFRYICVGDSDPFCDNGFVADTFPDRFALGGAFDLDFDPHDYYPLPDEPLPRVIAPAPDSVRGEAMAFVFTRAGYAAFLARNTRGEVIDLRHLYGAPVSRIAIVTENSQELSTLEMDAGQDVDVDVLPQDTLRSTLAGSLHYEYTTDDPEVAEIFSVDEDRDVTIRAVGPGQTTLKVTAGGFTQELTVVVAGEEDPTTSDTDDSDSDTDDPDSDSDSTTGDTGENTDSGGQEGTTGGEESTGGNPTTGGAS